MNTIRLHHPFSNNMTAVSNYFIDYYMPQASGEYVKLYLCLLRQVAEHDSISLEAIAELFDYTERDVRRGLQYWADQGLLDLACDSDGSISDLVFLEVQKPQAVRQAAASTTPQPEPSSRHTLSKDRMAALKDQQDIRQLLFIAESYLGHSLSPGEISSLLYYYDSLHFGVDLIEYLIESCVENGHKSIHYIQKVALSWADSGITTKEQAKQQSRSYNKNCYTVLNAFGIKNRGPAASEVSYIQKWTDTYGFTLDIIEEACSRTISATHQPSFEYADTILTRWHNSHVHHLKDISVLDDAYQKQKAVSAASAPKAKPVSRNLNNFERRSYDMDSLEEQLLNSN